MNRDDVDWRGYWPACPTPFTSDGELDLGFYARHQWYLGEECRSSSRATDGSLTPDERRRHRDGVDQVGTRDRCDRLHVAHGEAGGRAGRHAIAAGAGGVGAAPIRTYPTGGALLQDMSDGIDAPVMVYNWPHGTSVDIGPDLAARIAAIDNVVAIKDSTPDLQQFFETAKRVVGSVRVFGPYMSLAGLEFLLEHGGDGFIGGGSLWGAPDAEFWEAVWRGDVEVAREHARRRRALRSSGSPAAGVVTSAPIRASSRR
jgi:4-hydroxy-tetrahydrodipicolinate synthase